VVIESKIKVIDIDNNRYLYEFTFMFDHAKFSEWLQEHEYLLPMVGCVYGLSVVIARNKKKAKWDVDFCIQNESGEDLSIPITRQEVQFSVCRNEESEEEWVVQMIDPLIAAQTD